jgi:hypothetical protein
MSPGWLQPAKRVGQRESPVESPQQDARSILKRDLIFYKTIFKFLRLRMAGLLGRSEERFHHAIWRASAAICDCEPF